MLLILKGEFLDTSTPRVFLRKSADLHDSKGVGVFESAKEFVVA
jgi:hypothetical protein